MFKNLADKVKKVANDVSDAVEKRTPDSVKNAVAKGAELAGEAYDKASDVAGNVVDSVSDEASFIKLCRSERKFIEYCLSRADFRASFEANG